MYKRQKQPFDWEERANKKCFSYIDCRVLPIYSHTHPEKNHCEIISLSALFDDKIIRPFTVEPLIIKVFLWDTHFPSFFQRRRREEGKNCSKIWESEVVTGDPVRAF